MFHWVRGGEVNAAATVYRQEPRLRSIFTVKPLDARTGRTAWHQLNGMAAGLVSGIFHEPLPGRALLLGCEALQQKVHPCTAFVFKLQQRVAHGHGCSQQCRIAILEWLRAASGLRSFFSASPEAGMRCPRTRGKSHGPHVLDNNS